MDAPAKTHPTSQTLSSYGLGKLDDASAEAVNKHLELCVDCRRRVAEVISGTFVGQPSDVKDQGPPNPSSRFNASTAGLSMLAGGNPGTPAPPVSSLPPGLADHPDYTILRELGQGGMGVVYLAENVLMGRKEVLKVVGAHLINRRGVLERFLAEIRNAARLHHPNVVTAYAVVRLGESLVLAMEYVNGLDLARLVKARGPLPVASACNYVHQAAQGLQHAHEAGMVHRDIKPSNLMLASQAGRALVKVLDFGLAKVIREGPTDGALTHEGQMLGTPDFIAPEQISDARRADIRADIYSLGCTLYYLLTAGPPFQGTSLYDILQAHHSMDASPLNLLRPEVPVELAAIVAKMMAKEPERRFQEPREVGLALLPFFKKGLRESVEAKADVSLAGESNSARLVLKPTQPAWEHVGVAGRDVEVRKPTTAETKWESLIDVRDEEPSNTLAPAVGSDGRPSWKTWTGIVVACLFGMLALGGIIVKILDKNGRAIATTEAAGGHTIVIEQSSDNAANGEPQQARAGPAGMVKPATSAGAVGFSLPIEPSLPAPDPFQPGTSWRGSSTVLVSPFTKSVGLTRPLWLTIKTRIGDQFTAVADSPNGSHEANGTFKDGVVSWDVANEIFSWKGKLVSDVLAGDYHGTNYAGKVSGQFRLALTGTAPPLIPSGMHPPVGPARVAQTVRGDLWTVEGDQLVKRSPEDGWVQFGDSGWTDYDLSFDAWKTDGPDCFGAAFRGWKGNTYTLGIGGRDGKNYLHEWAASTREARLIQSVPGVTLPQEWYQVRISLRGSRIRITLDGHKLFDCTNDFSPKGSVSLRFYNGAGRFKNIKVTAPDNTVLWEGPPDLR